jgi:DNA-binding response OmpR family regulator
MGVFDNLASIWGRRGMNSKVILCIEDNTQVQMLNKPLLEDKGFTVRLAMTLSEAKKEIEREMPGLIVLDIHLPDGNGLDFLRGLRKTSAVPVIALTNSKEEQDVVEGLASGCDDYIPKPYTFSVLYARIEAVLRRAQRVPETLTKGALTLKTLSMTAFLYGEDLLLTKKEFALLLLFLQNEGKVAGADYLYEQVWEQDMNNDINAVKNMVYRLRKKIEAGGYTVNSVYNEGYCFEKL